MKGVIKNNFAGKERGFAFNMLTWEYITDILEIPFSDFFEYMSRPDKQIKAIRVLMYASLKAYSDIYGEPLELNQFQVGVAIEEHTDTVKKVLDGMLESMGKIADEPAEEDINKKKLPSKK